MPRESGPPGPAQESLLGSEEAAPELNAFEAFRAGWNPVLKLAGHNSLYEVDPSRFDRNFGCAKSLELAELRELNAAIAESSSRSCP